MGFLRNLVFIIVIISVFYTYSENVYKVRHILHLSKINHGDYFSRPALEADIRKLNKQAFLEETKYTRLPTATGGLNGIVRVYYISLCEMLVLYHSPRGCSGFTGRNFMNTSVTVLTGKLRFADEMSESDFQSLAPGETRVFRSGTKHAVKLSPGTSLLVYSRGFVPYTALAVAYDLIQTHFDPLLALKSFEAYVQHTVFGNQSVFQYLQSKLDKFRLVFAQIKHFFMQLYTENCPTAVQHWIEEIYQVLFDTCILVAANIYDCIHYSWHASLEFYYRVTNSSL